MYSAEDLRERRRSRWNTARNEAPTDTMKYTVCHKTSPHQFLGGELTFEKNRLVSEHRVRARISEATVSAGIEYGRAVDSLEAS